MANEYFFNLTFYTIIVQTEEGAKPSTIEAPLIGTPEQVISTLSELFVDKRSPIVLVIFQHDPDVHRRDVTEEIADMWWGKLHDRDFANDQMPGFIAQHMSLDLAEKVWK